VRPLRLGSLCSGYGGLELGIADVLDVATAWVSDIGKGACKILAHRHPDIPNLGDFTRTDWSTVEPVDVLCAGFPCQPVSNAGKRLGDEDERWLWDDVTRAVSELRPGLVVLENVRGLLTAGAGRLFGRVLGALADLGYDAQWHGLRAADVGAPHGRFRVFIVATDTQRGGRDGWTPQPLRGPLRRAPVVGSVEGALLPTPAAYDAERGGPQHPDKRRAGGHSVNLQDALHSLLPTPKRSDGDKGLRTAAGALAEVERKGAGADLSSVLTLLPTPAVNDMGIGKTIEAWDEWTAAMQEKHGNGNGHGKSLAIELQRVESGWGPYTAAVKRWEPIVGYEAPPPNRPAEVREWMQGLPQGWVTAVPDLSQNEKVKALGNGVVPQQAAAALREMFAWEVAA